MKFWFYYYFTNGMVMSAKIAEDKGRGVGPPLPSNAIKFEITEEEFNNTSLFTLNGKHPFPEPEEIK